MHDPDRVNAVRAGLPDPDRTAHVASTFALLGDANRLRLLVALRDGEMCVSDLAEACGQSESAVSHALRLLRIQQVAAVRRSGRHAFYRLADDHVRSLVDLALTHHEHAAPFGVVRGAR